MAGIASPVFSKRERIVSRKLIEQLFSKGSSFSVSAFPLRIVVLETKRVADDIPVQVLISVSKRHFKHAVDRNRVKRQVREAYRHHKQILTEKVQQEQTLAIAFIWLADELLESATVEKSVKRLLGKAAERLLTLSGQSANGFPRHSPSSFACPSSSTRPASRLLHLPRAVLRPLAANMPNRH